MNDLDVSDLESNLRYAFRNRDFLEQALRHSSFVNEQLDKGLNNNERLEFLGDSVLNMVISHLLMVQFPDLNEGSLSKIRSGLVNESQLALIARKIHLGGFIRLGRGEMISGGQEKASILADGFEALMAAVYLDGGFDNVFKVITGHFSDLLDMVAIAEENQDFKSRIQELAQATVKLQPEYRVINESGPDHDKTFEVELVIGSISAQGTGKSKKAAEQAAAKQALELFAPQG
ncbi:MAG: ribonuclease III [Desulfosalsimonadaceae bacterium]|nr:ribonuclease III [Desulfosalsimonadaceae bacterium]